MRAKTKTKRQKPILQLFGKLLILVVILVSVTLYSDQMGYFNPDATNNHSIKKWKAFYEFTKQNNIDYLLIGNSHLYTGINPVNLSEVLGGNSFILASPGTNLADSYFSLKEALKKCKPGIVVIETYGIDNFNPYQQSAVSISDQIKSFSARMDFCSKVFSTPFLFNIDNYIYAWSNTIRNHNYIFSNREQIEKNKKLSNKKKKEKKLYLGRFVRFTTGLEEATLKKYNSEGAPVDGTDYSYGESAEIYTQKIVDLCKKEGIELMFLTLPMYEKHIKNYPVWRIKLAEILQKYPNKWLNLQQADFIKDFTPECFENTYNKNQHITYLGSLIASYKLADFIKNNFKLDIPDRSKNKEWHELFYGKEGYFTNFKPNDTDKENKIICSNKTFNNITIKELLLLKSAKNKSKMLMLKVDKKHLEHFDWDLYKLQLIIEFVEDGKKRGALSEMKFDKYHTFPDYFIFVQNVSPLNFTKVLNIKIIKK